MTTQLYQVAKIELFSCGWKLSLHGVWGKQSMPAHQSGYLDSFATKRGRACFLPNQLIGLGILSVSLQVPLTCRSHTNAGNKNKSCLSSHTALFSTTFTPFSTLIYSLFSMWFKNKHLTSSRRYFVSPHSLTTLFWHLLNADAELGYIMRRQCWN